MGDIYKIRELGLLKKGMDMLVQRQTVGASNIANVSTPGYKAKRLMFEKQMDSALGGRIAMRETNPMHLPNNMKGVNGLHPAYTVKLEGAREDGNSVNLDEEMAINSETSLRFYEITTAYRKHLNGILAMIKGK